MNSPSKLTEDQDMLLDQLGAALAKKETARRTACLEEVEARRALVLFYASVLHIPANRLSLGNNWCTKGLAHHSYCILKSDKSGAMRCLFCNKPQGED